MLVRRQLWKHDRLVVVVVLVAVLLEMLLVVVLLEMLMNRLFQDDYFRCN